MKMFKAVFPMSIMKIDELLTKIETLETRQAFQEDTIESLNKVIIQQQQDIEQLKRMIAMVQERVKQSSDSHPSLSAEEPPPHY